MNFLLIAIVGLNLVTFGSLMVRGDDPITESMSVEEWKKKYDSLMTENLDDGETPMVPEETFKLIETLVVNKKLSRSKSKSTQVQELSIAGQINSEKCREDVFEAYDVDLRFHANKPHIVPFLKKARQDQYNHCASDLTQDLIQSIDAISASDKEDLDKMLGFLTETTPNRDWKNYGVASEIGERSLAKTVVAFMNYKDESLKKLTGNGEKKLQKVSEVFQKTVVALCDRANKELESSLIIYDAIDDEEQIKDVLGQVAQGWIRKGYLCAQVSKQARQIGNNAYELLKEEEKEKKKQNGCSGFFCFSS